MSIISVINLTYRLQTVLWNIIVGDTDDIKKSRETWGSLKNNTRLADTGALMPVNVAKAVAINNFKLILDSKGTALPSDKSFDAVGKIASGVTRLNAYKIEALGDRIVTHINDIRVCEDVVQNFIRNYRDDDANIKGAIADYVSIYNELFRITSNVTKAMSTMSRIVDNCNNYRMALLSDLSHRMQTVADMFSMAEAIKVRLEEDKAKASKSPDTEDVMSKGAKPAGQIAFNS